MMTNKIPQKRINEIKQLLCYIARSRVKTYYGSLEAYLKQVDYLRRWDRKSNATKQAYSGSWATVSTYRNRYNACFGIPSGLINDLLGWGKDETTGKRYRYSPAQMVQQLGGVLDRTINHGHKWAKDDAGYHVSGSWGKKYMINRNLFYKLWTDDEFGLRYTTLSGLSPRVRKLVCKYYKDDSGTDLTQRAEPPEEHPDEIIREEYTPETAAPEKSAPERIVSEEELERQINSELSVMRNAPDRETIRSARARIYAILLANYEAHIPYLDRKWEEVRGVVAAWKAAHPKI